MSQLLHSVPSRVLPWARRAEQVEDLEKLRMVYPRKWLWARVRRERVSRALTWMMSEPSEKGTVPVHISTKTHPTAHMSIAVEYIELQSTSGQAGQKFSHAKLRSTTNNLESYSRVRAARGSNVCCATMSHLPSNTSGAR